MTFITSSLLALSLVSIAYTSPLSTSSHAPVQRSQFASAPLFTDFAHEPLNGSFIIKLREDIPSSAKDAHMNLLQALHEESLSENSFAARSSSVSGLNHIYSFGYSGWFGDDVIDKLRLLPEVEYIEQDQVVRISDELAPKEEIVTQKSAPWGLARISHPNRLTFATFKNYVYSRYGGEGVDAYIIDTGIDIEHPEFEGRAHWGKTIPNNDVDEDMNGHGSHCAGTIASKSFGVAKNAHVYAVKVLGSNGSGTMSDVISGVEWAFETANAKAQAAAKDPKSKHKGSVANMSLGGGKSPSLDAAVNKAVKNGMHFAVAAGNDNRDACNYSPAAAENAITVAASTLSDERAYFSNYGKCVDVFGPGLNILSTWPGGATNTISGTSMASPHVAGLVAYLLSLYPSATFNPPVSDAAATPVATSDLHSEHPFSSMYKVAHAALPRFILDFLPSPEVVDAAMAPVPAPQPTISTTDMKKAIKAMASKNKLKDANSDLPAGTPNLLIFNNATAAH